MLEFFDSSTLWEVNFHFNFSKIIKYDVFLKSNTNIDIIRKDFYPVWFPDKKAFHCTSRSVIKLSPMVPGYTICSNDALIVKLNTILPDVINVKTYENFSLLNKNDLIKLFKFSYDIDLLFFDVRLQSCAEIYHEFTVGLIEPAEVTCGTFYSQVFDKFSFEHRITFLNPEEVLKLWQKIWEQKVSNQLILNKFRKLLILWDVIIIFQS